MKSYNYNGKIVKASDEYYFYDYNDCNITKVDSDCAKFWENCKKYSFKDMIDKKIYSIEGLRALCKKSQNAIKSKMISYELFDQIEDFVVDVYNINFIWDIHINIGDNTFNLSQEKIHQLKCLLDEKSYRAKVFHFAIISNNDQAVQLIIKQLKEEFKRKTIFYSIYDNELINNNDSDILLINDLYPINEENDNNEINTIEKFLNYWIYGNCNPPSLEALDSKKYEKSVIGSFIEQLKVNPIRYKNICWMFKHMIKRELRLFNCSAGINSIYLDFDSGDIKACKKSNIILGNIKSGISEELRNKYFINNVFETPKCKECWAKYLCGRGCRLNDTKNCEDYKAILERLIVLYHEVRSMTPELLEMVIEDIDINRHECTLSPISEKCIVHTKS